jgi:glutamate synthase (NADPH/NADH) small chain
MGAGRKAARSMKAYLGIRDDTPADEATALVFGIAQGEHNFARVRAL